MNVNDCVMLTLFLMCLVFWGISLGWEITLWVCVGFVTLFSLITFLQLFFKWLGFS